MHKDGVITTISHKTNPLEILLLKSSDYLQLIKLRLTLLVVFSAGMGYLFAVSAPIGWSHFSLLLLSGFLITGSANGINQIIERDLDKLMSRTANRPVAAGRLHPAEAVMLTGLMGIAGVTVLSVYMNTISALLGLFALLSYAFVYTPLKRFTPLAVVAGAFPGALPTIIGYTAISGTIDIACIAIFAIQFVWQFPHFWAIAWLWDDDYKKAGFNLLPVKGEKNKQTGLVVFLSTVFLIPVCTFPLLSNLVNIYAGFAMVALSLVFLYFSYIVYRDCSLQAAKRLLLASITYLPVIQLILVFGKI